MPNRTLTPKHSFSAPKTLENSPKPVDPELGRFKPFLSQTGFGRGRRFRQPPCNTRRLGRRNSARRPRRQSFTTNRCRTPPDRAGERSGGRQGGSSDFAVFRPFQADPYLPPPIFGPSELIPVVLFLKIPHCLKDTTKTSLADSWIEFFGHHNNFWTKVRVLLCSWSLGLSVDIKFVNFGRRLVNFPFFGHFG